MQLSRSLLTAEGGEELFHSHLKNQLITPIPDGFQGIHFKECLWPAGKLFWSPCHVCSFLRLRSPLTVNPLVFRPLPMCLSHFPDSSSHMGGLDPPLGLVSVFSPVPQSLLNHPLCLLLIIVPLSPHSGLPHQPGAETLRRLLCTVIPFLCGEHGMEGAGPGAARMPKSRSKRPWMKGQSVLSSVLRPGAAAQRAQGEPAEWERGMLSLCVDVSVIPWGWIHPQQ